MEVPVTDTALAEVGVGPEKYLSPKERDALKFARNKSPPYAPLAPSLQVRFFNMFLQGVDCSDIVRLNPGMSLGQVITARIEGKWDEKRQEHIETLMAETRLRLQQTTLEGIDFVSTALAAVNKLEGDKLKKYLQDGDKSVLGDFSISNWSHYIQVLNILKSLTGQDKITPPAPPQKHEHTHKHEHSTVPAANRGMKPEEARGVIEGVLINRRSKG